MRKIHLSRTNPDFVKRLIDLEINSGDKLPRNFSALLKRYNIGTRQCCVDLKALKVIENDKVYDALSSIASNNLPLLENFNWVLGLHNIYTFFEPNIIKFWLLHSPTKHNPLSILHLSVYLKNQALKMEDIEKNITYIGILLQIIRNPHERNAVIPINKMFGLGPDTRNSDILTMANSFLLNLFKHKQNYLNLFYDEITADELIKMRNYIPKAKDLIVQTVDVKNEIDQPHVDPLFKMLRGLLATIKSSGGLSGEPAEIIFYQMDFKTAKEICDKILDLTPEDDAIKQAGVNSDQLELIKKTLPSKLNLYKIMIIDSSKK